MEINFETVRDIIVNTLSCDAEQVTAETNLFEDLDADSLEAVELSLALEEAFGVGIADEDMTKIQTVSDIVAYLESKELMEKGFLTSSCCPAFVTYIHKFYPKMVEHISHNLSPMAMMGKVIKKAHPECKIVFIGPCVAKKGEAKLDTVKPYIDAVLTFEELQAMIDAYDIDLQAMEDDVLNNASYFGRIFARSGGLSEAVAQAFSEKGSDFQAKPVVCSGIEECRMALMKLARGIGDFNFIEGMACVNGCINGAGCVTHGAKNKSEVDKYGREAMEKNISDAISMLR